MAVIGESFMSATLGKVIEKGFEYLTDQYDWQTDKKDDLTKLKRSIPQIQAVVRDADAGHLRIEDGPLRDWWWQLRDALYAADDVLDDFEYLRLQDQVLSASSSSSPEANPLSKVCKMIDGAVSSSKKIGMRAIKQDSLLKRLREVVRMFDDVCDGLDLFERLVTKEQHRQQKQHDEFMESRETSSMLTRTDQFHFLGRDKEREKIVELLLNSSELGSSSNCANANDTNAVSLVSIVGHGGMGKTTLAQHVFNDKRIYDHFDLKIWVCISNSFSVKELVDLPVEGFQRLCSLEEFKLVSCPKLQQLAVTTHRNDYSIDDEYNFLPSSLRKLTIGGNGDLDRSLPIILQRSAPSVTYLWIEDCQNMVTLPPADVMRTFTSLQTLRICDCRELVSLAGLMSLSCRHLYIGRCSKLVEAATTTDTKESTSTEEMDEKVLTVTLHYLIIDDPKLLQVEPLRRLNSVGRCDIQNKFRSEREMAEVVEPWLHQNRYTLEELHFSNLSSLSSLSANLLKDLTSLKELDLRNAPDLLSLPLLPPSLETLTILGCNSTLKERCKKDSGADWPYIKHISTIWIELH